MPQEPRGDAESADEAVHLPMGGAFVKRRSLAHRIWGWLGFGYAHAPRLDDEEEMPGYAPGWLCLDCYVVLDWPDRLRVLLSGKLMLAAAVKTDAPVARSLARSALAVLPPTYRPVAPPSAPPRELAL